MKPPPTHTHPAHSTYCSPLHRRMTPSPYSSSSSSSSSSLHSHSAPPPDCSSRIQLPNLKIQTPRSSADLQSGRLFSSSSNLTLSNPHKTGPLVHSSHTTTYTQNQPTLPTPHTTHQLTRISQTCNRIRNRNRKKRHILKKKKNKIPKYLLDTKKICAKKCRSREYGWRRMRKTHLDEAGENGGAGGPIPSCGSRSPSQVPWERRERWRKGKQMRVATGVEWIANCGRGICDARKVASESESEFDRNLLRHSQF